MFDLVLHFGRHDAKTNAGFTANEFEYGNRYEDLLEHIAHLKTVRTAFEVEGDVLRGVVLDRNAELVSLRKELEKERQLVRMEKHRSRDLCIDVLHASVEQIRDSAACGNCVDVAIQCNRQAECSNHLVYGQRKCVPMAILTRRENALVQLAKIEDELNMPAANRFARNARDIVPLNVWLAAQPGRVSSPPRARRYPKYPGMRY